MIQEVIITVIGGLGIFLLGMKNMSEGMQAIAGGKLRKIINAATSNRVMACAVGVMVTCIVQSSSVTTVMVVSLVNSAFMTLTQAIGVILGANIGTTITGWILVLKIGKYGLPILGVAAFVYLFSKNERARFTAMAIMGIGMIFFGLELMSNGFKPLRSSPDFLIWFQRFQADNYFGVLKCAAVGCVVTMIVQSSSATLGITMGLATSGLIGFETAAALVLGENIGTTITAYLASLGATTNAKRAAYSHIVFNILGVIVITAIFAPYIRMISGLVEHLRGNAPGFSTAIDGDLAFPNMRLGIALVHSGFNVANTLIFLPFVPLLAKLVTKLAPDKPQKEIPHLTSLDIRILDTPAVGIQQSFVEVLHMGRGTSKMMRITKDLMCAKERDEILERKVFHREEILDVVQREIVEFLSHMLTGNVSHEALGAARMQLRMADEYESISDYIASILKLQLKMRNEDMSHPEGCITDLMMLHEHVSAYQDMISEAVAEGRGEILSKARTQGDEITRLMKDARARNLSRVESQEASPLYSLIYTDMLTHYRRIKDHALNIAEALAGEK